MSDDNTIKVTLPVSDCQWAGAPSDFKPVAMIVYDDSSCRFYKAATWMRGGKLCIRYRRDALVAYYDLRGAPPSE